MEKVSIIIPCYNVGKYISFTLQSVLSQTYKNFEVICVDDGSTDNTYYILKEIEATDGRVKVFRTTNGGVNIARKFGFANSIGSMIVNLDSDDLFYNSNSLEYMVEKHIKYGRDITSFTFRPLYDGSKRGFIKYSLINRIRWFIPFSRDLKCFNWYMWAKVYSRSYYAKCKFKNIKIGEDRAFAIDNYTKNVKFVNRPVVLYRVRPSSAMSNTKKKGAL